MASRTPYPAAVQEVWKATKLSVAPSVKDLRFEWPQARLPIFFIVDDPTPRLNLAHFEQYWEPHVRDVPNSFTGAFADVVEEFGVGASSVCCPSRQHWGALIGPIPGVRPADQQEFLRIVRERVAPQMDICLKFLTHFLAWDIRAEKPLDYTEKTTAPFTSREHLTDYFAYGLRIL